MIKIKAFIYKLSTKVNDLPVTHRMFMASMVVSVMYGLSVGAGNVLALNTIDDVNKKESEYLSNIKKFKVDLKTLQDLAQQPEKILIENKIKEVDKRTIDVEDEIELITRLLIDPKTMTKLLDNIVKKQSKLKLKSLKSIDHVKQEDLGLFQHQIEITVEGDYLDISRYLHDLEAMPFKVYWKSIDYKSLNTSGQSPKANVVLTIYTLSRDGGWLGV